MDPEWSETGDRYLLKLFRDYIFHQVTETGAAWVDFAHIVATLNRVSYFFTFTKQSNHCIVNTRLGYGKCLTPGYLENIASS